jgi:hypothetical protein
LGGDKYQKVVHLPKLKNRDNKGEGYSCLGIEIMEQPLLGSQTRLIQTPVEETEVAEPLPGDVIELFIALEKAVEDVVQEYQRLENENMSLGGEEGATIFTTVDSFSFELISAIRKIFKKGLMPKTSFFGAVTSSPLLPVLSEITLKNIFAEIMEAPTEVDPFFGKSSKEKEMAWIVMALNEWALSQYVDIIRQNVDMASKYYIPSESIILQDELASKFLNMLHRLDVVSFDLELKSLATFAERYEQKADEVQVMNDFIEKAPSLNQSITSIRAKSIGSHSSRPEDVPLTSYSEIQPNERRERASSDDLRSLASRSNHSFKSTGTSEPHRHSPLRNFISENETAELEIVAPSVTSEITARQVKTLLEVKESIGGFKDQADNLKVDEPVSISTTTNPPNSTSTLGDSEPTAVVQEKSPDLSNGATSETISSSIETTLTTKSSMSRKSVKTHSLESSDLGFFGFNLPHVLQRKSNSILTSAFGMFTQKNTLNGFHYQVGNDIPGDFEFIDRVKEKENLRLDCSGITFETRIRPISGLASQDFQCFSCHSVIGISDYPEALLCEISGKYFCSSCHQMETTISPALIIKNWDFRKVPVAHDVYLTLSGQCQTELFDLESLNPSLFNYVNDLILSKELRQKIIPYTEAIRDCHAKDKEDMIKRIWPRDHLIETINLYTIEDLVESHAGKLSRRLQGILESFEHHTNELCSKCRHRLENVIRNT